MKILYLFLITLITFGNKHGAQFRWWILDISHRYKSKILLITANNIINQLQNETLIKVKSIELGPLDSNESIQLLLSSWKRIKTVDDLNIDNAGSSLYEALKNESNFIKCRGEPQQIIMLANLLELNDFSNINIDKIR